MDIKEIISSGILEQYAMGLTSQEESIQVHEWMKQYTEVKAELDQIEIGLEQYALANAIEPDKSVKEKIFATIKDKDENFSPVNSLKKPIEKAVVYKLPAYYNWGVAASVILLIGSLIFNYTYYNKYNSLNSKLQTVQNELASEKQIAAGMSKDMDVVTDKNALPVVLNGTPHAPDALAKIFWMKNTGDVYVDPTNLPQPATGMQYQLWAIVDGKPVDAGMISTQKGMYKIQRMKSFGKAQAFAITLEKVGGSPTPNMNEMYVMAKI